MSLTWKLFISGAVFVIAASAYVYYKAQYDYELEG